MNKVEVLILDKSDWLASENGPGRAHGSSWVGEGDGWGYADGSCIYIGNGQVFSILFSPTNGAGFLEIR